MPSYIGSRSQADVFVMIYVIQGCVGPEETGKGWQQQLINNSARSTVSVYTSIWVKLCVSLHICHSAGLSRDVCASGLSLSAVYKSNILFCIWDSMYRVQLCTCSTAGFVSQWWISTSGKVALWPQAFPGCSLSAVIVWRLKSSPLIKLPGRRACVTLHRCLAQLLEHHTGVIPNQQGPT